MLQKPYQNIHVYIYLSHNSHNRLTDSETIRHIVFFIVYGIILFRKQKNKKLKQLWHKSIYTTVES